MMNPEDRQLLAYIATKQAKIDAALLKALPMLVALTNSAQKRGDASEQIERVAAEAYAESFAKAARSISDSRRTVSSYRERNEGSEFSE